MNGSCQRNINSFLNDCQGNLNSNQDVGSDPVWIFVTLSDNLAYFEETINIPLARAIHINSIGYILFFFCSYDISGCKLEAT
jgi:hypothetical protein